MVEQMADKSETLKMSLENLGLYTRRGRELAWHSIELLDDVVEQASNAVCEGIDYLESKDIEDVETGSLLATQLEELSKQFSELPFQIAEEIETLPDEKFTISLYGRTKVGKSTLVSILTRGDGSIIGDGSQRTTREAKTFPWEGLRVIDVPGVSATGEGGEEDARKALAAARPSDLIIFIVTRDSLQKETAGHLAQVRALGKPVICFVNVKKGRTIREGHEDEDVDMLCRQIDIAFSDEKGLRGIRDAVLAFDEEFSQKWGPMPFAYAHFKSAFMAQQARYSPWSKRLLEVSRFPDAIGRIADEIGRRGCFLRLQSYTDTTTRQLIDAFEGLSRQSADCLAHLRVLNKKMADFEAWIEEFSASSNLRTKTLVTGICDELRAEADTFSERHFSDKLAMEQWAAIVKGAEAERRANELIAELREEATEKVRALGREISIELDILRLKQRQYDIKPKAFVDKKRIWNRAMTVVEVALGVTAIFTEVPAVAVGLAAGAQALGNLLLKDGKRRREDAVREFRRRLEEGIKSYGNALSNQIGGLVQTSIVSEQLDDFYGTLRSLYGGIATLGSTQLALSDQIKSQINELNLNLVKEALEYGGDGSHSKSIIKVARIPGDLVMLVTKPGATIPSQVLKRMTMLLGEVVTIAANESGMVPISAFGIDLIKCGAMVESASEGHVIAYPTDEGASNLRSVRAIMQLNDIVEFG